MHSFRSFTVLAAAGIVSSAASVSSAAILAQYTYPSTDSMLSTVQPANGTASAISESSLGGQGRSSSFYDTSLGDTSNGSRFWTVSTINSNDEAGAITANDYHAFTITPSAGYELDLSELRFSGYLGGTGIGGTPDSVTYFARSSVDNYSTTIGTTLTVSTAPPNNGSTWPSAVLSLGTSFQNIETPTTFRIYLYKAAGTDAQFARLDSVQLSGDIVQIPEPASLSLLGLAAVGVLRRRR